MTLPEPCISIWPIFYLTLNVLHVPYEVMIKKVFVLTVCEPVSIRYDGVDLKFFVILGVDLTGLQFMMVLLMMTCSLANSVATLFQEIMELFYQQGELE